MAPAKSPLAPPALYWIIPAAIAAALHFISRAIGSDVLHALTKPIPMICLMGLVTLWAPASFYRMAILVGFVFSLGGDIFLMPPLGIFLGGLGSFLIGHICYIAAFSSGGVPLRPVRVIPFLLFGVPIAAYLYPGLSAADRIPVIIYMCVILTMGWRAAARIGHGGENRSAQWAGLIGAVVFIISDTTIALDKFKPELGIPGAGFIIMATYWAGQVGIALSVRRD